MIDIMNDHGLEQMVHFPTREKNTLDLILTTLPGQVEDRLTHSYWILKRHLIHPLMNSLKANCLAMESVARH